MKDFIEEEETNTGVEVHDNTIGRHRVSFVTQNGKLAWVVIDDAHFTADEFDEMSRRFNEFQEEEE